MSNKLKIIGIGATIILFSGILTAILFNSFLSNLQLALGITRTTTPGFQDQEYLVSASSSPTIRSDSYSIAGAERVTLFIGSSFFGPGDSSNNEQTATWTVEVSDVAEPGQGAATAGTTTPFTLAYNNTLVSTLAIGTSSPMLLESEAFGTTTIALDLRQNTYSFLRVVRTGTTADIATSTVSIIKQY